MFGKKVLVTGASGFIGRNLVKLLVENKCRVTCLVRRQSNIESLEKLGCRFVIGDLGDRDQSIDSAVADQETVFHLAALTKSRSKKQQFQVNVGGFEQLLSACSKQPTPPTVVMVSSLAAVGPNVNGPHVETDPCCPISNYGKSKFQAELIAAQFAGRVPISIVRPPIVLGGGDREGLILFKSIQRSGIHAIPGFKDHQYSLIHCDDLSLALMNVADKGKRISTVRPSDGIYFVCSDEVVTYRELGEMIARTVGRTKVRIFRTPNLAVWILATANSTINFLFRGSQFFTRDKAREATAGSWSCNSEKIRREMGWQPAMPLADRLHQTAQWYRHHGWLANPQQPRLNQCPNSQERTPPPKLS